MKKIIYLMCSLLFIGNVFANDFKLPLKELTSFDTKDFTYVKFSAFPYALDKFAYGVGVGYRKCISESNSIDFSSHIIKTESEETHMCAKINHVFYFLKNYEKIAPYVGFGASAGICYFKQEQRMHTGETIAYAPSKLIYAPFVNGELNLGLEFHIKDSTVQLLELTYCANSNALQISLGVGF